MKATVVSERYRGQRGYQGAEVLLPASAWEMEDALQRAGILDGEDYSVEVILSIFLYTFSSRNF